MSRSLLLAYPDRFSVAAGETIRFQVSCEAEARFEAELVRLQCGYADPAGPGFKELVVESELAGTYPGRAQHIEAGSYVRIEDAAGTLVAPESLSLRALIWPTLPARGDQVIMGRWRADLSAGYALLLDDAGRLAFRVGDGDGNVAEVATERPLEERVWYTVEASSDSDAGVLSVRCDPRVTSFNSRVGPLGAPAGEHAEKAAGVPGGRPRRHQFPARRVRDVPRWARRSGRTLQREARSAGSPCTRGRRRQLGLQRRHWPERHPIRPRRGRLRQRPARDLHQPARAWDDRRELVWLDGLLRPRPVGVRCDSLPPGRSRGRMLGAGSRVHGS